MGDIKLFECPVSSITRQTWQILQLVNDCISAETGDFQPGWHRILGRDIPPEWFLEAVRLVRTERANYRQAQLDKAKTSGKK